MQTYVIVTEEGKPTRTVPFVKVVVEMVRMARAKGLDTVPLYVFAGLVEAVAYKIAEAKEEN